MFDLKKPCKSCPFLKVNGERFGLSKARLQEDVVLCSDECARTFDEREESKHYD